jgi:lysophospholipase L1-like esterase
MDFKMMKNFLFVIAVLLATLLQLTGCSSLPFVSAENSTGIIDADNPNIQYVGRFNFSNPKNVTYDWPGIYICAKFEGTSCKIRLNDHENEYAVIIDDRAPRLLYTDTSRIYNIVSGLADFIPHTIMIQKRTESFVGKGEFDGFIIDNGRKLLPPDKRPERKIEFIGNSITCGYGVEGESPNCHFSIETENACMSYASITSRALNADYHLISYSGRGVVRNYGDSNKTSVDPMPSLYDRTCFYDSTLKWNFTKWIPQAVVINLGTNDFSTQPYPDKNIFQEAYLRLINRVRVLYPGITIFCICGPMIAEPCTQYIKEVVELDQKNKRDKDVFFIEIKPEQLDNDDWGCDHHPNIGGMSRMSDIIVPIIRLRMNW